MVAPRYGVVEMRAGMEELVGRGGDLPGSRPPGVVSSLSSVLYI